MRIYLNNKRMANMIGNIDDFDYFCEIKKTTKTMKIKKGFVLRNMCGENIVTAEGMENINFNKLISLNGTAAFLWKNLEGKEFTEQEMAQLLVDEYGIDKELALKDSINLCKKWAEAGITD